MSRRQVTDKEAPGKNNLRRGRRWKARESKKEKKKGYRKREEWREGEIGGGVGGMGGAEEGQRQRLFYPGSPGLSSISQSGG